MTAHPQLDAVARSRRAFLSRGLAVAILGSAAAALPGRRAQAAPSADLWQRWLAHDPSSRARIDHTVWDRIVGAYTAPGADGITRFAYAKLLASAADRRALAAYIGRLTRSPIGAYARAEQRPYWLNLYNALTITVILDHYPVASIRDIDISPGLFADGPWGKPLVTIDGEAVSLDDIEHRILRPIWADPRIHYGVNCAALGCPDLQAQAFTAGNCERLLDAAALAFVNHPRGAWIDGRGRLTVSSIYVWFEPDFGGDDAGVIAHLRRYANPPLADALAGIERIGAHGYDWSLNDAQQRR